MRCKQGYWQRLSDEKLEAAAVRAWDRLGVAHYNGRTAEEVAREVIYEQVLTELDRRHAAPQLWADDAHYMRCPL